MGRHEGRVDPVRFYVTIDGKEREVELKSNDQGFKVRVGNKDRSVDFRRISATSTYSLLVNGKSYAISAIPEGQNLVLKCKGESYRAEVQTERERAAHLITGQKQAKGPMTVEALIPGFVSRVLVSPEDKVMAGQSLLIIEAMKMQNEVVTEVEGVVREVHVEADQTVRGGDPLVTIEIE